MSRARRVLGFLFACVVAAAALPASGQTQTVVTPLERISSRAQVLGSQHRPAVERALRAAGARDLPGALAHLQPVIAYCDGLSGQGRRLVSLVDEAEYTQYVAATTTGEPVDWVDMACPEAYKIHAFIDVENKDAGAAFAHLDKAIRLAPFWADPLAERGYLLNQVGKPAEALASYSAALALVDTHPANRPLRAVALRGVGYSHVELGDLDRAEQAYLQSIEVDPGSEIAKHELEYIRQHRAMAQPKP